MFIVVQTKNAEQIKFDNKLKTLNFIFFVIINFEFIGICHLSEKMGILFYNYWNYFVLISIVIKNLF